jgi:hypothetical protein
MDDYSSPELLFDGHEEAYPEAGAQYNVKPV